ncbi:MAG TPA: hypothetical protein VGM72_13795 [Micropepsaceae bacterium]|jgi:hypothetical protein
MADFFYRHWAELLKIVGAACGMAGTVLMANRYVKTTKFWRVVRGLVFALVRGEAARSIAGVADIKTEKPLPSLQGLAFIAFGFFLQLIPDFIALFASGSGAAGAQ